METKIVFGYGSYAEWASRDTTVSPLSHHEHCVLKVDGFLIVILL